ncbi:MAG TPA: DUF1214 domain-containing protein [Mycobacteriales bacterium]|nr:DUF1214 domain-containing protein [Mycobacteriales bacterium]
MIEEDQTAPSQWESTAAWRELLTGLGELDQVFLTGPKAVGDDQAIAEGYRALATALEVAFDTYLFADPTRPIFVDLNTPFRRDRRWGGDNTDAYYTFTPIDPSRRYRITGNRGDSVYFSLTIYNEPTPGSWSNQIVAIANDDDLTYDEDGNFEILLGPSRPDGYDGTFLALNDDGAIALTRDYQVDPLTGRRIDWVIEALDPPGSLVRTDAATAVSLRTALRWVQMLFAIIPLTLAPREDETTLGHNSATRANDVAEPYQVQDANFGWSARDAAYCFGSFSLEPDEALVVTHRPPACRFWNVIVWNQFMAGHNVADERTSVNIGSAVPNSDGTVTVVIARERLAHPNAISTVDRPDGAIAFRWFIAESVPAKPTVSLVKAADAPTAVT